VDQSASAVFLLLGARFLAAKLCIASNFKYTSNSGQLRPS
jgi:hypothetical protein